MNAEAEGSGYGSLWRTWGVLLTLTVVMVFLDVMNMPRWILLVVLLGAMLTKASLIALRFMDLAHEKWVIGVGVAFSVLFLGAILYALMVPDALAVLGGGR